MHRAEQLVLKRCSKSGHSLAEQQPSSITADVLTCLNLLRCMMRTSGKVQRLSVMLPCCSCLQCGHRHASSGASYKEEAWVGMSISFQIPRQLSLQHCSTAAPGPVQTLTPAPHLRPAFIKLIGNAGFPMMLFKIVTSRETCVPYAGGTSHCKTEFS